MMHSLIYISICLTCLACVDLFGVPSEQVMMIGAVLGIAILGVPHGGLDHWTGRRLLAKRFSTSWWFVFFPLYLAVGLAFVAGWFIAPSITVVLFFVMSAWHFGREDEPEKRWFLFRRFPERGVCHASAIATGGVSIWIPAVVRPEEFYTLLSVIVPSGSQAPVASIAETTQYIAYFCIPVASWFSVRKIASSPHSLNSWVPVVTAIVAAGLPILFSFSIYFCGWHSWQGLQRMRRDERLGKMEFLKNVAPLSTLAILGVVVGGCWLSVAPVDMRAHVSRSGVLQTLFIGLSAIAVPHLLLHEVYTLCSKQENRVSA